MTDHDAIERLKRGDISGLETLVTTYQVKAVRTAYLITQDRPLAEDAMQTAFIRVYDSIHQFDSRRPFEPYFMRIVVNTALKVMGSQNRAVAWDMDEFLPDTSADPAHQFEGQEQIEAVRAALQQLAPEQRAVIVMRYYLGYSESEIANQVERPIGTVRWRMHTAHQQLRGMLKRSGMGG